jgi:Type II secretion system (T2SS), protein E, N-terminal domain
MLPFAARMANSRGSQRIGEVLVAAGLLDAVQLKAGLAQLGQWGGRLTRALSELGLADEEAMADAIARAWDMDRISLGTLHRDPIALKLLPASFCKEHGFFPVVLRDRVLHLAVSDPSDLTGIDEAGALAGGRLELAVSTESEIQHAIERHYFNRTPRIVSNKARKAVTRDLPIQSDGGLQLDTDAPPMPAAVFARNEAEFDFNDTTGKQWTPELVERLKQAQENQKKTTLMFKVVRELLFEKGVLEE